jgi:hypothetical protein
MLLFFKIYQKFYKPSFYYIILTDLLLIFISAVLGIMQNFEKISNVPDWLNIGQDWSAGEFFNYAKWGAMVGIFAIKYSKKHHLIYLCLAVVFTLILGDDSLQFHERFGLLASKIFQSMPGFLGALGEIVFWILLGTFCLTAILFIWPQTPPDVREKIWPLAILFCGVVFFGVFIDFIHFFAPESSLLSGGLLLLEDGGEMIFISLMASYSYSVFWRTPQNDSVAKIPR